MILGNSRAIFFRANFPRRSDLRFNFGPDRECQHGFTIASTIDSSSDLAPASDSSDSPSSATSSHASSPVPRVSYSPTTTSTPTTPLRRKQTVYDAVARKSGHDRFLYSSKSISKTGKFVHTHAVPPETILASRWQHQLRRAGLADEIDDVKMMQAGLVVPSQRNEALPDSDLLEALHYYAAEFYEKQGLEEYCTQQFDGTALLAMGIFVEELVRECLGNEGHKVFQEEQETETEEDGDGSQIETGSENPVDEDKDLDGQDEDLTGPESDLDEMA